MEKKILSPPEKFGLVSGVIGIAAGAYSLATLLGLTKASISIPFFNWVVLVILIFYAGVVTGFYSRQFLYRINQAKFLAAGQNMTMNDLWRIEQASIAVTAIITAPLCLMFLYSLGSSVSTYMYNDYTQKIEVLKAKYEKQQAEKSLEKTTRSFSSSVTETDIEQLEKKRDSESGAVWFGIILFGGFLSCGLVILTIYVSKTIYQGCDPYYPV